MKNFDELSKIESITTIVVNLGTIISWIITLVTALALVAQPEPISITGLFELGESYKVIFLISVLLGYIQLLRRVWSHSQLTKPNVESRFISYLYASIVKFKRPVVLIGFVIIFTLIFEVDPVGLSFFLGLVLLFGAVIVSTIYDESPITIKKIFWLLDDEFYKRWLKRVRKQLYNSGYVFTSDFSHLDCDVQEINWAIETYFNRYEFEQNLILTRLPHPELLGDEYFLELRFDHLPTRLPSNEIS